MPYVLPQVRVFQDFTVVPAAAANPLRACIVGPHAYLLRYDHADERPNGNLGFYDDLEDHSYPWPTLPAGAVVDQPFTKLWIKDALLRYFQDFIGQDSVITKTSGYNNRIRSATVNFAGNGGYARSALLLDRDVQPGDVVKVRGLNGTGDSVTLWTYVKQLLGDPTAAVVAAAASDADNASTQGASAGIAQVAGAINCLDPTADGSAYNGLAEGDVNETYDILVIQASVDGDYTKAAVRVISGSGHDDVASVTPEAAGVPTAIGTRGLTVTFQHASSAGCSASAGVDDVTPNDLIPGQRWQVTVHQAFTKPVPTSGGSYDGTSDTTYVVTVSRGGKYADAVLPQVTVSTTNGVDLSGPTTVAAASTPVAVGTLGVTIEFSGTALRKGDIYYVDCTGVAVGPMRTIVLGHNLDTAIAAGSELDLTLFIRNPLLQVGRDRVGEAPITNWQTSATEFSVTSGITAFDPGWTDNGVPQPLDVLSESTQDYGILYVEYRAWRSDLCTSRNAISDPGALDLAISGPLDPANPLKQGVFEALVNSGGTEVTYLSVCNPDDPDSWADALGFLVGHSEAYGLVPLSYDRTVLDLFVAHVDAQSAPEEAMWRVVWVNLQGVPEIPVVSAGSTIPGHSVATTTDGTVALAVIEDDPQTAGTQYTILRVPAGNAGFTRNGVRPGDIARVLYTGDGFGGVTYSEFVVASVVSEDELKLAAGPAAPVNVAAKMEIWRNLTPTEEATAIGANAGSYGNRRVRATWPDTIGSGGTSMPGIFMNCALAGLASGILPHQGMTRLALSGFDDLSRTTRKFNRDQLDIMAGDGAWIVTQDAASGSVFTRHAITTGVQSDINQREEVVTRNVDSISFRFQATFDPFIGVVNVTPGVKIMLEQEIGKLIDALKAEAGHTDLGGQLIDATITSFEASAIEKDRYVLVLSCEVPYALNNLDVHLVI